MVDFRCPIGNSRDLARESPAHNPAGVSIDDEDEVGEADPGRDTGDVGTQANVRSATLKWHLT